MNAAPLVIERTYNAPADKVWEAITDPLQMKQWYFDLPGFKAEVGYKFEFMGGDECRQYRHLCEVTEVIPGKKLSHTWRYDGYPGDSTVTWELFVDGDRTRVVLTHEGLETFEGDKYPELHRKNFEAGWTDFVGKLLKEFVEQ